ncbi:recombinase family protein [Streptomyces sp. NPDC051642]|uniref:recombinase family protein n=1 Tax=Streptomyces sp. NPDC051642 TaxID=3154646 RepID=UPI0034173644
MTHTLTSAIDLADTSVNGPRLRAVDYLRVSTEEQAKGYGIAYTGKKTGRYVQRKGWLLVGTYADEGVSGSLEAHEREDLKRLMENVREDPRPFDVVVVAEGRAIGRTGRAFWRWVWELEDLGVCVAVVKGDYDNTTADGRKKMRKDADYAEEEREVIRERTQGGLQEKAEEGGYTGGNVPYGWRVENQGKKGESRLVLDICGEDGFLEGETVTLRRARALIAVDGMNWGEAAGRINLEGFLTRSGVPWSRDNLKARLMSRAVLEGIQVFRDPRSGASSTGRGTKLDRDGNPIYGSSVTIKLDKPFTEEETKELIEAAKKLSKRRSPKSDSEIYPLSARIASLCGGYYVGTIQSATRVRNYVCTGKHEKYVGAGACSCSQIHAETIEAEVWGRVTRILGDPEELRSLAADWVDVTLGAQRGHAERIEELDGQIAVQQRAIATVMRSTSLHAAAMEMGDDETQELLSQAVGPLRDEVGRLKKLRQEAVDWQRETEAAEQLARDMRALAEMAHVEMPNMPQESKADFVDLADIKVTILSPVPLRKALVECSVGAWFKANKLGIPVEVTDEQWVQIEPLVKKTGRGFGKSNILPLRECVEAVLGKARAAASWSTAAENLSKGNGRSLMKRWLRWEADGTWARVIATLEGAESVPVPEPSNEFSLPDLLVEGKVEPRLLLGHSETGDQTRVSTPTIK